MDNEVVFFDIDNDDTGRIFDILVCEKRIIEINTRSYKGVRLQYFREAKKDTTYDSFDLEESEIDENSYRDNVLRQNELSHFVAYIPGTSSDTQVDDLGSSVGGWEEAVEALYVHFARQQAHIDLLGQNRGEVPSREKSLHADGNILHVNENGEKCNKGVGTKLVRINADNISIEKLAEIAKNFDVKEKIVVRDWRFYHPHTGLEVTTREMEETYSGGEEGGYVTKQIEHHYYVKENSYLIYKDGLPVYANNNGVTCTDRDALCDSLL